MHTYKVGYLVGSLAKSSINRKLAKALTKLAPPELQLHEIRIGELPLYSYDYDADYPQVARDFKQAIAGVDGVLFVTPEYNRSIPGVLKNAIDTASRPYGDNAFDGKPAAVIGTSPGAAGTAVAQQHLRNVLVFLNLAVMAQPEAFLQYKEGLIDADGSIGNDGTRKFLQGHVDRFMDWIAVHRQH